MVMSSAVQVCWEKFCNYCDVEARYVPITEEHRRLDGTSSSTYVDENTIGVVAIMGVTYTGMYEPVEEIAAALDAIQAKTGLDIPIHVDGASGGMIAPFLQPDLEWDFRLAAGALDQHLRRTSTGSCTRASAGSSGARIDCLPEDLIFRVSYLGGDMPTFALNFSRPGAQVLLQYYLFLRLGHEGYCAVQRAASMSPPISPTGSARWIRSSCGATGRHPGLRLAAKGRHTTKWELYDLSDRLRESGWLVPAYPMPDDLADVTVQRIVVRNGLCLDLADRLLDDITDRCLPRRAQRPAAA